MKNSISWSISPLLHSSRHASIWRSQQCNTGNSNQTGNPTTSNTLTGTYTSNTNSTSKSAGNKDYKIPEITLILHPENLNSIDKARENHINSDSNNSYYNNNLNHEFILKSLDPNLLKDDKFLNKLQSLVSTWIKEIHNVTPLNRDVESGMASREINFWLSMEKALQGVEEQLKSESITLTFDILKTAKRYHTTVSILADTGKKLVIMIQELLVQIFGHIDKKLKILPYTIRQALPLAKDISKDLTESLLKVLINQRLMYMEHESFPRLWSQQLEYFKLGKNGLKILLQLHEN
ncbi:hypothetical protein KEM48_012390 [Puccinia striiformis f. sp. tritici PST-130]|uniref:Dynein heavy chain tail domain-containing protein n=1 Tax=Puccinia striiformis f. sp. tritici PST-78 TaxID=1165861 RepID=A0A0L0W2P0_9BASI|nr:hypothetical protein KEM48_012390 [Puccinia striiformis f. sp. tritici PST-130]KNF05776.1 hypothetical protein PSTG_01173 [Puccinia striiformis f. sp. tritici PST-78]